MRLIWIPFALSEQLSLDRVIRLLLHHHPLSYAGDLLLLGGGDRANASWAETHRRPLRGRAERVMAGRQGFLSVTDSRPESHDLHTRQYLYRRGWARTDAR